MPHLKKVASDEFLRSVDAIASIMISDGEKILGMQSKEAQEALRLAANVLERDLQIFSAESSAIHEDYRVQLADWLVEVQSRMVAAY